VFEFNELYLNYTYRFIFCNITKTYLVRYIHLL